MFWIGFFIGYLFGGAVVFILEIILMAIDDEDDG